ncbi:MAG TPA: glycoside hydrolase family 44 protein [Opitutaceae bacterium]
MSLRILPWALATLLFSGTASAADLAVQVSIDPTSGRTPISPYIYGTNQDLPGVATPGARRYGGNRLTGYNWETNASNAGTDYLNESDNYLVSGLPQSQQSVPAVALTTFQDQSIAEGAPYSILTLQMAGYVSADEAGPVTAAQAAPSARWVAVQNNKPGGSYSYPPDTSDGTVYMDELLHFLVSKYGPATGRTGVRGYDLDNEPSLWPSTHPYLHPAQVTCAEEASKSVALATTVKRMDPAAEVLGPVSYGSEGYFTFQNAPDWPALQASTGFRWFIDYYLDQMSKASAAAGTRLLDVLDLHRYSDENVSGSGPDQSITNQTDFTDKATDMDRVQAPRVLWDKSYVENSWVQQYDSQFLPWIPNLQASIAARFPGTKLSFTEYNYGGESDISGGIAQADVLGIYGKFGVYLGCEWLLHSSPAPLYAASAFNLFLNYDGSGGAFGGTSVAETDSDTVNTSAYASVDAAGSVHAVVINKSFTQPADVAFTIAGPAAFGTASVYAFDGTSPSITARAAATLSGNKVTYTLAPLTAAHFVFRTASGLPQFTASPSSQTISAGSTVVFTASSDAAAYQWYLNGSPLSDSARVSGSSGPQLVISGAGSADAGSYTCVATNGSGSTTSAPAALAISPSSDTGRLVNLSCRAQVGSGANILIAGFAVGGPGVSGQESLLLRASGPALASFGVSGTLADPQLGLYAEPAGSLLQSNDGWAGSPAVASAAASAGAFAWASPSSHDSAILTGLSAGSYTAQVAGQSGDTGIALAEVYDNTPASARTASTPRLVNLSARVPVGTGPGILVAGFVIGGSTSRTVLVRASGPALAQFAVSGTLADPQLSLYRSNPDQTSTLLQSNAGWGGGSQLSAVAARVGAFSWGPAATADSAILVTLPPGAYTAQVAGASGDTGVSLVEVYEVD